MKGSKSPRPELLWLEDECVGHVGYAEACGAQVFQVRRDISPGSFHATEDGLCMRLHALAGVEDAVDSLPSQSPSSYPFVSS